MQEKNLKYMEYVNRENNFRHFRYETEMKQYELLMMGKPEAAEEAARIFSSDMNGRLSKDELRHYKYLFVAAVTLAARYAVRGGMDTERAYNASDLYINKADLCNSIGQVIALHREMFEFYSSEVASTEKKAVCSRPVILAMDYIYYHPVGKYLLLNSLWLRIASKTTDGGYALSGKTGKSGGSDTVNLVTMNRITITGTDLSLTKLEFEFVPRVQ